MPKACLTINTNSKLFPAVLVNSGMSALDLVKETLSDEILLIVASELIANVPSYSAWNCAVGTDEGAPFCWKKEGEGEGGHWGLPCPHPQRNIYTTWLNLSIYADWCHGNWNPGSCITTWEMTPVCFDKRPMSFTYIFLFPCPQPHGYRTSLALLTVEPPRVPYFQPSGNLSIAFRWSELREVVVILFASLCSSNDKQVMLDTTSL